MIDSTKPPKSECTNGDLYDDKASQIAQSDIAFNGAIMRFLPAKWHPYIMLARLDRPVGVWLLLWPCFWSVVMASFLSPETGIAMYALYVACLFFCGAVLMRSAGCVVNDIWDRKYDKQVARTALRPLASGALSLKQAFLFLALLLALSLIILLQFNALTILLGLAASVLVVIYPLAKRFTYWPQLVLGLVFNFGALMGWAAISEGLSPAAYLLYLGGLLWTIGYDTIYAYQDSEDDALIGVKSTALLFGDKGKFFIILFYLSAFVSWCLAGLFSGMHIVYYLALSALTLWYVWKIYFWQKDDFRATLSLFKVNIMFGGIVCVSIIIGSLL